MDVSRIVFILNILNFNTRNESKPGTHSYGFHTKKAGLAAGFTLKGVNPLGNLRIRTQRTQG